MRVIVTGSRTWKNKGVIRAALTEVWHPDNILVSGHCQFGADAHCEACWTHWGGQVELYPAPWERYGRRAGFVRNATMVNSGADHCLAFVDDHSRGATMTGTLASRAGIPVTWYSEEHAMGNKIIHRYVSTYCLHDDCGKCSSAVGEDVDGHVFSRHPAQCKVCAAPCMCPCHTVPRNWRPSPVPR